MNTEFLWDLGPENAPFPEPQRVSVFSAAECLERDAAAVAEGRQTRLRYSLGVEVIGNEPAQKGRTS